MLKTEKLQATLYPEDSVSGELQKWFSTTSPEDYLLIPDKRPQVQILSYLDFISSLNRKDYDRAQKAWIRIVLSLPERRPVRRMPARAWGELLRKLKYL